MEIYYANHKNICIKMMIYKKNEMLNFIYNCSNKIIKINIFFYYKI